MNSKMSLPLFPLNTVLFPGQVLPLHIFEPRYRQMIGECIEKGLPFGVVLIKNGEEVGKVAEPYEVGTTARITQVERMRDGRLNIITVGEVRFRILALKKEHDYLTADVSLWPWLPGDDDPSQQLAKHVRSRLARYVDLLSELTGMELESEELPDQPNIVACLAAIALQVTQTEKQELLNAASIGAMLAQEIVLLRRELRILQIMLGSFGRPKRDEPSPTFSVS